MKTEKYPEYENTWDDDKLPPPQILIPLFEMVGTTYPRKILVRRVNLLTKTERKRTDKLWKAISHNIEEIDDIISTRAEIKDDPWK